MTNIVLIISQERDQATNYVLEYIEWNGGHFFRLNEENLMEDFSIYLNMLENESPIDIIFKNNRISLHKIKYIWYRRGDIATQFPYSEFNFNPDIQKFLIKEWLFIKKSLHYSQPSLGNFYQESENNKLTNLKLAQLAGFKIPDTLITTNRNQAIAFLEKHKKVITKPIHNCHLNFSIHQNNYLSTGTRIVTVADFEFLDTHFAPMLLQSYIEKELELRVFFLDNQLFPMAIFSQLDEQTSIDYRNYNEEIPNRNVPFKFEDEISKKIMNFTKMSQLNTGSIDLILTPCGEYLFLEVNPTGQYGWVSYNCNYHIENHIAQYLLKQIKK